MSLDEINPTTPLYTLSKVSGETSVKRGKNAMPMSVEKIDYEEGISDETKKTIRDYIATFYPGTQLKAVRLLSKKKGKDVALVYVLNEIGEMSLLFIGGSMIGAPYLIFSSPLIHSENIVLGSYLYAKKKGQKVTKEMKKNVNKVWKNIKKRGRWLVKNGSVQGLIDDYWR